MESILNKVNNDRVDFDQLGSIYPGVSSVDISNETIGGVNSFWFTPKNAKPNKIIIYLHGGSFALGSLQSHQPMVSHFTLALQTKILFIDYALAPEKPFPHGVNDVLNVYKEIIKRDPDLSIFFIGDSAGGGLIVSNVFYATKDGLKLPDAVVLISPWINLRCNNSSYEARKTVDPILTKEVLQEYAGYYAPTDLHLADPSQFKFEKFPPAFLLVGSNEILFDDSKNFYETINPLQQNIQMKEYNNLTHVWLLTDIQSDGAKAALQDIKEFIAGF